MRKRRVQPNAQKVGVPSLLVCMYNACLAHTHFIAQLFHDFPLMFNNHIIIRPYITCLVIHPTLSPSMISQSCPPFFTAPFCLLDLDSCESVCSLSNESSSSEPSYKIDMLLVHKDVKLAPFQ